MARPRSPNPSPSAIRQRKVRARKQAERQAELSAGLGLATDETPTQLAEDAGSALEFLRSFMRATPSDSELAAEPDVGRRSSAIAALMSAASKALEVARARRELMSADEIQADAKKLAGQIRLAVDQIPAIVDNLGVTGEDLQNARAIGAQLGRQILEAVAQRISDA